MNMENYYVLLELGQRIGMTSEEARMYLKAMPSEFPRDLLDSFDGRFTIKDSKYYESNLPDYYKSGLEKIRDMPDSCMLKLGELLAMRIVVVHKKIRIPIAVREVLSGNSLYFEAQKACDRYCKNLLKLLDKSDIKELMNRSECNNKWFKEYATEYLCRKEPSR